MPARPLLLSPMIPLALLCGACTQTRPQIVLPPATLAECADEPLAPELPAQNWSSITAAKAAQLTRDTVTLTYLLALRSAFGDCKAKVAGLKAWRDAAQ